MAYLEPCVAEVNKGAIKASVLARTPDDDANFTKLLGIITASGGAGEARLGRAEAGVTSCPFLTAWKAKTKGVVSVDATKGIDNAFALKSKTELVGGGCGCVCDVCCGGVCV